MILFYISNSRSFSNTDIANLTFTDLCIGKRSKNDKSIDGVTECSKKLEHQIIGLLQANEYFVASNDSNCNVNNARVCQNYNFLASHSFWTITASSDDTTSIIKVNPGQGLQVEEANNGETLLPVLYLKSDTAIKGGSGTQSDPYILR